MGRIIRGKVWRFGGNIGTDHVFPGRYLSIAKPEDVALNCIEAAGHPTFREKAKPGGLVVAGDYFGYGFDHEQAPVCLKYRGINVIIAGNFARIFFRNTLNVGLAAVEAPEVYAIEEGNEIEMNLESGEVRDLTAGKTYQGSPFLKFLLTMLEKGGRMPQLKERVLK
jgi:3-isopropylmalate/(R)-2-methylmalate dehydratase small subunit